jgi:hypothetical protein
MLKVTTIRPNCPGNLDEVRALAADFVDRRLHSPIGLHARWI